ncbi:MAG: hypothetical protein MJ099_02465 [Clostridia bacterium]|nr:hypothetical protein [Clostridia bacterium]
MKSVRITLILLALLVLLTGCGKKTVTETDEVTEAAFNPEQTAVPVITEEPEYTMPEAIDVPLEDDVEIVIVDEPETEYVDPATVLEPVQTSAPSTIDSNPIAGYSYVTLADTTFGFVYTYPSHWENLPGRGTVCFREPVAEGEFPARVAVTVKELVHTPRASVLLSQFQNYAQIIYRQYPSDSFEWSPLNKDVKWLGNDAMEISYLAFSGEHEVRGYMICTNVGRFAYVFHFVCEYDDYNAMEPMMRNMRDSVTVLKK